MSDEGEKTCPLCAEEMDLTDQQLKPCKCGYDICVWCWHHIMDMAEKDDTEGRCPACRTPYNKEKIVGTASKCERLVAEMSVEKKQKSVKGKSRNSEGRKQLSSVRVIQRNLVYIVGLPLNLADEDILQRKEYFGQYGKVIKVSISRTAAGSIQHFANSTCSVYITYSKEDEAVRSIQAVHGFVLDGRPLRACFGTTKYCHAWLRNMACTNPECLYLHEFGSQEDSFTKDEIISEYTRGRVQQVTGAVTNDIQRRSGNILPPATVNATATTTDDYYSNNTTTSSWPKPSTNDTFTTTNSMKGSSSPPSSSSGRSVPLPAAASWGTHASNTQPISANTVTSNGPSKQKPDTLSSSTAINEKHIEEEEYKVQHPESTTNSHLSSPKDKNLSTSETYSQSFQDKEDWDVSDEGDDLSADMSSLTISRNHGSQQPPSEEEDVVVQQPFPSNPIPTMSDNNNNNNHRLVQDFQNNHNYNKVEEEVAEVSEAEADLLSFNNERLRDPQLVTHTTSTTSYMNASQSSSSSSHLNDYSPFGNHDRPSLFNIPLANGHSYSSNSNLNSDSFFQGSNGHSFFPHPSTNTNTQGSSRNQQMGIYDDAAKRDHYNNGGSVDLGGENSIISNILSMDFDPWNDSLNSPQNLSKLLGNTILHNQQQQQQILSPSSRKTNQSRFSFARDEDQHHHSNFTQNPNLHNNFNNNGFSSFNFEESSSSSSNHSSKIQVSRSQISAPPGFMGPTRTPPPGFTSNERIIDHHSSYDNLSGNHMFDSSSILRKVHHQAPVYNNDIELMDPAILAIGGSRDMRPNLNYPSSQHHHHHHQHSTSFENDNRLRLLMQRSFSHQNQNQRFSELDNGYGLPSRIIPESSYHQQQHQHSGFQQPRMSNNNGHWDSWNEVQNRNGNGNGNGNAMAEILRNERLGFNKYYSGL